MDFRRLRYFTAVADAGSFSKAAKALGVSQPTVSQQISILETEFCTQLFYRTGRGVVLTDAGAVFLARAQNILGELKEVEREICGIGNYPSGRIRLGVPPSVSHAMIASFALQLRKRFPNVTLHIIEGASGFVREWLSKDRLDLGILYKLDGVDESSQDVLLSEELSLVCRVDDPILSADRISFDAVVDLPLILPSRPHGLRTLLEKTAREKGKKLAPVLEMDGAAISPALVSSGCGYTVLPDVSVLYDLSQKGLACMRICDPVLSRTMVVEASIESRSRHATQVAIQLLKEQSREFARTAWST